MKKEIMNFNKSILGCILFLSTQLSYAQFTVSGSTTNQTSTGPIYVHNVADGPVYIWKGNTPGSANTGIGTLSLSQTVDGNVANWGNTAVGFWSIKSGGFIKGNTALGSYTLANATTTDANTAIGYSSMVNFSVSAGNTACGYSALEGIKTGTSPNFSYSTGIENSAFGKYSIAAITSGSNNTGVGNFALRSMSTGNFNTAVGNHAMKNKTSGDYNTVLGNNAFSSQFSGSVTTGSYNTAIGTNAMLNKSGDRNAVLGYNAFGTTGSGNNNAVIGSDAMYYMASGNGNTAVGNNAMHFRNGGDNNTVVGNSAFNISGSGNNNCAFGSGALSGSAAANGSYNVAIGSGATFTSAENYQLSIQNIIYGIGMDHKDKAAIRIGSKPSSAGLGTLPAGVIAKLSVYGVPGTTSSAMPSLQLDFVPTYSGIPPVTNPNGNSGKYLFVDAAGIVCQASLPVAGGSTHTFTSSVNTLTSDVNGIIRTAPAVNTVVNTIANGELTTSVNGVQSAPIVLPVGNNNLNIYTGNGSIDQNSTTGVNREVDMNERNIWFRSAEGAPNGKIYIGYNNSPVMFPIGADYDYRLYVEKGILTEKVKVAVRTTGNWSDYVFADDYKLMPLKTVEAFVKANKHLPGIDAADELVKNGLDLGEMQAKQMGKIEELTLYIIDQNKAIEKQTVEIETLKAQVKLLLEKSK